MTNAFLGEIVSIQTGKLDANASSSTGPYPFFTCAQEPLKIDNWKYDLDAVLVAGNGDLNVKHYKGKFDAYQRTYILTAKNKSVVDMKYLYFFLDAYLERLREQSIGGIIKYIKMGMLTDASLPLPPLPEQRRIAAILDQADALREKRRAALAQFDEMAQAIFMEMFGDPTAPGPRVRVERLGVLTTKIGSGATPTGGGAAYKDEGIALIRSMNVRDGSFKWRDLARIDKDQARKLDNVEVVPNDVLLNITGASVARVCRAPAEVVPARVNQHVSIIRTGHLLQPEYLESCLLHPSYKAYLLNIGEAGATRQAITKAQIEMLKIPLPDLDTQSRFVSAIHTINRLRETSATSQRDLDTLFASLQHRAFTGDL